MEFQPARHSIYGDILDAVPQSVTTLPAYSRRETWDPSRAHRSHRSNLTEHVFHLSHKQFGKPWATLTLQSHAPSAKSLPAYVEGEDIIGSVLLQLDHADHISCIRLTIQGRITTGSGHGSRLVFLNTSSDVWSKEMGDPRGSPPESPLRFSGPLDGRYEFPFSITLPKDVVIDGDRVYRLPASLLERHTSACVYYELTLSVERPKFRHNSRIQTMFSYLPVTQPGPPSPQRQLAYQTRSLIPGPEVDPNGWLTLSPATISGTIFSTRNVELSCTLSLATPLCYTRGSCIPLNLTIASEDRQALDLLGRDVKSVDVRLRRRITFQKAAGSGDFNSNQDIVDSQTSASLDVGKAVWWPAASEESELDLHADLGVRKLSGEIRLDKSLKPSCAISHFALDYFVILLPFRATGFVPSTLAPPIEERVAIATTFARGPRPTIFSPPLYDPS